MGFHMKEALMPQGVHLVEVSDVKEGTSKGKGTKQWTVTLRGWEHPTETVMTWWPIEGTFVFKTRRYLALLGFSTDDVVEPQDLLGRKLYVAIKHEEYQGQMGAKVDEKAEGSSSGAWAESNPPPEVAAREASAADIFKDAPPAADVPNDGGPVPF